MNLCEAIVDMDKGRGPTPQPCGADADEERVITLEDTGLTARVWLCKDCLALLSAAPDRVAIQITFGL